MSATEGRLSQLLHELVPEPPVHVAPEDVARRVRRRRSAVMAAGAVAAAVVAAAVVVPLVVLGGGSGPVSVVGTKPPAPALTRTYTWPGVVRFDYPAGWYVREFPFASLGPAEPGPFLANQVLDGGCWTNPQAGCGPGEAVVHLQPTGAVAEWSVFTQLSGSSGFSGPVNATVDGHPARVTSGLIRDRTCHLAGSSYTLLATIQTDAKNVYVDFRACYSSASMTPLLRNIMMSAQLLGPENVAPNVLGLSAARAIKELEQAGYRVQEVTVLGSPAPPGTVVAQDPVADSYAPAGSTVLIRITPTH